MWTSSNGQNLLLEIVQTSEGAQHLSHYYWELLVELEISLSVWPGEEIAYNPQTITFLTEAQEWSKLEYWMGIVWMVWPPGSGGITEEDLDHSMLLLCRQRLGAVQKLEQWMERWGQTATMTSLSHLNESANRRKRQPNRTHRKFPSALTGRALPSLMVFRSF
jgi:hypothetical protein